MHAQATRFGLGFRKQHFAELAEKPAGVDWLEVLTDNYLGVGGPRRAQLDRLRGDYPLALHGVSLGVANDAPPTAEYVAALRELADRVQPLFVSDHLCWTGFGGLSSHDLLPIAASAEVLARVADRVARIQDALGRRVLLENASAYVKFRADEMSEAELLAALCERTGCGVLLDVNNLFVNAKNLGCDPHAALEALAPQYVGYLHVAGHARLADGVRIDTHGAPVPPEVWLLFESAARRFPEAGVMLERDDHIPPLAELIRELAAAREHWRRAQAGSASAAPRRELAGRAASQAARRSESSAASWSSIQRTFWTFLAERQRGVAARSLARELDAGTPVAPARGLRVYGDAYAALPAGVLAANFPTLARVLTRADFAALCADFARAHPWVSHDSLRFGAALADFVARYELTARYEVDVTAFADVARLEQAQLEAQEAPDAEGVLTPEALAALPPDAWETARFRFAPAVRLVFAAWDVLPVVRAARGEGPLPLPKREALAYVVTRARGSVQTTPIGIRTAIALAQLRAGAAFPLACDGEAALAAELATSLARVAALEGLSALEDH